MFWILLIFLKKSRFFKKATKIKKLTQLHGNWKIGRFYYFFDLENLIFSSDFDFEIQ